MSPKDPPLERLSWRDELDIRLKAFENRLLRYYVIGFVLLKFDVPSQVTVPAVALLTAKTAWGFFSRS